MKEFLDFNTVRNNGFKLARKIFDDGFKPDVMYVSMRGGAYLGNAMDEFFKVAYGDDYDITFGTLVARSYSGIHEHGDVKFDGWTFPPEHLAKTDKVLVVDDICDSGATLQKIERLLIDLGLSRNNIRFAVHDYKCFHSVDDGSTPKKWHSVDFIPEYWCRKHDIYTDDENLWIHYLSHELISLNGSELEEFYFKKHPELKDVFKGLKF